MLFVMEPTASEGQIQEVVQQLECQSFQVHRSSGARGTILAAIGTEREEFDHRPSMQPDGIKQIIKLAKPYRLAAREFRPDGTTVEINGVRLGGEEPVVIADISFAESEEKIAAAVTMLVDCRIPILHVGICQSRSSLPALHRLSEVRLQRLRKAADRYNLLIIAEVQDTAQIDLVAEYADLLQVEMHNKPNFTLLRRVAQMARPVALKRGIAMKAEELLLAAEYVLSVGNPSVILCEQGIRTFQDYSQCVLDVSVIPAIKELSHLPIIVDPNQAAGLDQYVLPLALASIAAGADGLMIGARLNPQKDASEKDTSLEPGQIKELLARLNALSARLHRRPSYESVNH